jgi:phospholipid/cholesterol/gamma-HCH transport system permease protein
VVTGAWTLPMLAGRFDALEAEVVSAAQDGKAWDLQGISSLDGAGAVLLWRGWSHRRPLHLRFARGARGHLRRPGRGPARPPRRERSGGLASAGAAARRRARDSTRRAWPASWRSTAPAGCAIRPHRLARDLGQRVSRGLARAADHGAGRAFLVGVTLSYLTSRQLKVYGADVFIVNILGIGVWRELGPMLAAILIAGRSGSAMTAQLGVMRVTQELDALSVMGISHTARLVLPKVLALALAMPLVTVWTCLGDAARRHARGACGARHRSDPVPARPAGCRADGQPGTRPLQIVGFGALIAFVACHFGLRVKPDTESLAAGTTASVVSSITVVIMLDALVAVLFSDVGF